MRRSFAYWEEFLSHARDGYSRPLQHATRVHWMGEDAIAIQHHYTDIVRFYRDGRITLANGGFYSVTTKQRLNSYSPARLFTIDGDWVIPFEFDPHDPPPQASTEREIPKPFHVSDPGPEPVKSSEGCIAGEREEYSYVTTIYAWPGDPVLDKTRPGDWQIDESRVERWENGVIEWTDEHVNYWSQKEAEDVLKRCPHCAEFAATHEAWDRAMNGRQYARNERERCGYALMVELLDTYGTREAWQEAYITEFRAVREARKAHKAWRTRNHCGFHGGIEVTPSGVVPLRVKREHLKALRRSERERVKHNRMMREHEALLRKCTAQVAEERRVKGMIAQALAESVVFEIDNLRPAWAQVKVQHREVAA